MAGAPGELLYDRMKTAVIGEDAEGLVSYNVSLVALLNHYGALPRACRPYRAKTKGKVERPYRYIRQDFFLGRTLPRPRRPEPSSSKRGGSRSPTPASMPPPAASSRSTSPRSSRP